MTNSTDQRQQMLSKALKHIQAAIELLDRADAPGQIAAGLDLTLHQLGKIIVADSVPSSRQIDVGSEGFGTN